MTRACGVLKFKFKFKFKFIPRAGYIQYNKPSVEEHVESEPAVVRPTPRASCSRSSTRPYPQTDASQSKDAITETQTAIPKKNSASILDQLRNLSCTNGLAKVLESVMLERLIEEVKIRPNQYGGIRGSKTKQFLINMWDRILRGLDDPNEAVSMVSIDFSKVFNHVEHATCLRSLAKLGASTDSDRGLPQRAKNEI